MEHLIIRPYREEDRQSVVSIWRACDLVRSSNDPDKDIDRKLNVRPDLFLVAVLRERRVGTVMAGYEGHRGWINYLAVLPDQRRQGIARTLLAHVETLLLKEGCPKINLQVRSTHTAVLGFYQAIGYVQDDVVSLGRRIIED